MKTRNFGMGGFFGKRSIEFNFGNFREKWSGMSEEEKKAFVEKKVNFINEQMSGNHNFSTCRHTFTVEKMNKRFDKWQNMSDEEKENFVKQRNNWMSGMCTGGH